MVDSGRGSESASGSGRGRGRGRKFGLGRGRERGHGRGRDPSRGRGGGRGRGRDHNDYTIRNRTNQDLSQGVTRFFKVLYEDKESFSQHLCLPPDFAATVGNLLEKETYLEDSSGKQWTVMLSNVNDSLAFKKGWKEFSLSHGLKTGQVLEFHYIMGSHFVVYIFGTNGYEITEFNGREIIHTADEKIAHVKDEPYQMLDVNSINKPLSSRGDSVLGDSVLDAEIQPPAQTNSDEKSSASVKDTESTGKSVPTDAKIPFSAVVQG